MEEVIKNILRIKNQNAAYLEEGAVTCAAEFVYVQKTHWWGGAEWCTIGSVMVGASSLIKIRVHWL